MVQVERWRVPAGERGCATGGPDAPKEWAKCNVRLLAKAGKEGNRWCRWLLETEEIGKCVTLVHWSNSRAVGELQLRSRRAG